MGEQAAPVKPGWYPHRYGDEGEESYWNGREWTGESRPKRSVFWEVGSGVVGRRRGALGWVLLAIVLDYFGSALLTWWAFIPGLWVLGAGTFVWVLAALKARSTSGRAILWIIVGVHAIFLLA